jgi:hypothetical protein
VIIKAWNRMREEEVATEISLGRLKKMYYVSETCEITKVSKTYSSFSWNEPTYLLCRYCSSILFPATIPPARKLADHNSSNVDFSDSSPLVDSTTDSDFTDNSPGSEIAESMLAIGAE